MSIKLLRANEVADMLNVPRAFVYTLAREGRLPGAVRLGQHVRFDPRAIEEFIAAGGRGGWRKEA